MTGCAGFIGFHLAHKRLLAGEEVLGVDNLNDYYDVSLKLARLETLKQFENFSFVQLNISDRPKVADLFQHYSIEKVVNLAAQAGVRYSLENPLAYIDSNVVGFTNIIEGCRHQGVKHLVYASTSSVYGSNTKMPYSEADGVDHPCQIYAATKRANELIAHSYSHLYGLPTTGLRFFTVYGPWGRPDMAFFKFTKAILEGNPIDVYNNGQMQRDFTYVDDIVEGISRAVDKVAQAEDNWDANKALPHTSDAPFKLYNIGNGQPVMLMDYIAEIEKACGKKAKINFMPFQDGDVLATHADTNLLAKDMGYEPQVSVEQGVAQFVDWYRQFYRI
jgi:UDP-glucuronate 4-epimerase